MDSQSLTEAGFGNWLLFASGVEDQAPETSGGYAFRQSRPVKLLRGQSDIVYIGRAMSNLPGPHHNLRHALREYLHPGRSQKTKIRIGRRAIQEAWEVSWKVSDSPDSLECELLRRFYHEHGQLPPDNRAWPPGCFPWKL
jgi:hypothetical protein